MYRALVSPKQPACSSSGNALLMVAIVPASSSFWQDKEYNALPTAGRLICLPVNHKEKVKAISEKYFYSFMFGFMLFYRVYGLKTWPVL